MNLEFREARSEDVEHMFSVRARTRQNPASRELLASYGITPESTAASLAKGTIGSWVCLDRGTQVGFCSGDGTTGEVLVLAVLPAYEGQGIGKRLLSQVVDWLGSRGFDQPWLAASPDPNIRAHGFYRSLGWRPTGQVLDNGDQILSRQRQGFMAIPPERRPGGQPRNDDS